MSISSPSLSPIASIHAQSVSDALARMRLLTAQVETGTAAPANASAPAQAQGVNSFSSLLKQAVEGVNELQQQSSAMRQGFEDGTREVSLVEVMLAQQKASMAFTAVNEVRNKLVSAYKEIQSMPL